MSTFSLFCIMSHKMFMFLILFKSKTRNDAKIIHILLSFKCIYRSFSHAFSYYGKAQMCSHTHLRVGMINKCKLQHIDGCKSVKYRKVGWSERPLLQLISTHICIIQEEVCTGLQESLQAPAPSCRPYIRQKSHKTRAGQPAGPFFCSAAIDQQKCACVGLLLCYGIPLQSSEEAT